jgi:hypothetical protein
MQKILPFLTLCLFVLWLPAPSLAQSDDRLACTVQEQLFGLMSDAGSFLSYIETGSPASAPAKMEKTLTKFTTGDLRKKLQASGLESAVNQTFSLLSKQRKILEKLQNEGVSAAQELALDLRARNQLATFRKQIVALPCDGTERNSRRGSTNLSQSETLPIGEISVIATVALLVLAAIFTLLDRREKIKKRRWKRFPCRLECVTRCGDGFHLAQVVDLSQVGAKLQIDCSCQPGDRLEIGLDGNSYAAKIIWQNSNFAGVVFRRRISVAQLRKLLSP